MVMVVLMNQHNMYVACIMMLKRLTGVPLTVLLLRGAPPTPNTYRFLGTSSRDTESLPASCSWRAISSRLHVGRMLSRCAV